MNRAIRRRKHRLALSDPRLWDHEPLRGHRWLDALVLEVAPESEIDRDHAWGKAHGWEWSYFPDGSKTARTPYGKTIRFPSPHKEPDSSERS